MNSRFPVIIFDFDGTLIDSAPDIALGLNRLLVEQGRPELSLTLVKTMIGDGAARLVERAFAATGASLDGERLAAMTARYLEIYGALPVDPSCFYPKVVDTLATLRARGHRLALCTNKPEGISRALLVDLGIAELFEAVAGGDTVTERKPHPAPVLWVLRQMGVGPDSAVMVGDSINDIAAGRGAGLPTVAVSYGYPRMPVADLGADAVIDRFADLPAALERLA